MKITVNDKDVDLSNCLPLRLKDLRALKKEFDISLSEMAVGDVEKQANLFFYVLHKANKDISMDDVDTLSITQMTEISREITEASFRTDVPSSASSTN